MREWTFLNVRTQRAKSLGIEERRPKEIWVALCAVNVPPALHSFVIHVLWCKLPVVGRLFEFKLLSSLDFPLCGAVEHHQHVLKCCPLLSGSMSIVRRLWTLVVQGNLWIEPSRIRLEHSLFFIPHTPMAVANVVSILFCLASTL